MDSWNSKCIQSSSIGDSGGGETMSAFFNYPTTFQLNSLDNGASFSPHNQQNQVAKYDFNPLTFSSSPLGCNSKNNTKHHNSIDDYNYNNNNDNLGVVWPKLYNYSSTVPSTINDSNVRTSLSDQQQLSTCATNSDAPSVPTSKLRVTSSPKSSTPSIDHQATVGGGRNPRKRSRASRRTPTTVLTTDTSNFRQMVQEFTGIPAPQFPDTFSSQTRLGLFKGSGIQPPLCFMRPFNQKIVPHINQSNTSLSSTATVSTTTTSGDGILNRQGLPSGSVDDDGGNYDGIRTNAATIDNLMASENYVTKGESMVDSWICSSR